MDFCFYSLLKLNTTYFEFFYGSQESEEQHLLNMQRRQQQLLEEQKILQEQLEYQKQQSHQEQLQRQQIEEEEERQLLSYYSEMQSPMSQQPFMRSASARLPRHKYDPERDEEEEGFKPRRNSGSGSGLYTQRRTGAEYGSQKFQQVCCLYFSTHICILM